MFRVNNKNGSKLLGLRQCKLTPTLQIVTVFEFVVKFDFCFL